jgi:hypothetical protein
MSARKRAEAAMRRRNKLLASALILSFAASLAAATPATAQVSSAPLAQVDAWGVGWMGAADGAVASSFWNNTNAETIGPLLASLQPKDLSPAGRTLLRRILASRTKGPDGGGALTPERLRLLEGLGESAHAADLRKRYPATEWGKTGALEAAEIDLLNGREDQACAALNGKPAADAGWMPLRAVCAALKGDAAAAGFAAEQVAKTDEALGVWLIGALPAMASPDTRKPDGRYATPLEAAISVAAKLPAPANAFTGAPGDIAAAVALNADATSDQRRAALRPAFSADKIKAADALVILSLKQDAPAAPARSRAAPRPDYIAQAIAAASNKDAKPEDRAGAYAAALRSAETPEDGRLIAAALAAAIKALPRNEATLAYAEPLARAAITVGDTKLAADWRKHLATLPKDSQDAWALARIDLMLSYAGGTTEKPGAILDRMLDAAPPPPPAAPGGARAASTAEQLLTVRRIENARALFLAFGMGRDLSAAQRTTLSAQRTAGRGVSDAAIARITAAARAKANAEAALAILGQLGTDTSAISFAGVADLLTQLRDIGLESEAAALTLEALQPWKAL